LSEDERRRERLKEVVKGSRLGKVAMEGLRIGRLWKL
jgi:hypothetical protein